MSGKRRRDRVPLIKNEERSLVCLIQALVGKKVVVELRSDVIIKGKLDMVDEYLNLTMSAVTVQTLTGRKSEFEFMYVKGRNIRIVHLPKAMNPEQTIEAHRKALVAAQISNVKERFKLYGTNIAKGVDATLDDREHAGVGADLLRAVMGDSHGLDEELLYSGSDDEETQRR